MSILLNRLLQQAVAKLADGDMAEAETLCGQVLAGAAALLNIELVAQAAEVMKRIPPTDHETRASALLALHNKAVSMQRTPVDDVAALKLCDSLLELTPPYPVMHCAVHNMAVFIATRLGPEQRNHYIARLLTLYDGVAIDPNELRPDIEIAASDGPSRATAVLATRGVVLVRGLFDSLEIERLRETAEHHFDLHQGQAFSVDKIGGVTALLDSDSGTWLGDAIRPFFPVPPLMQPRHTFVRRVTTRYPETVVPFHQDVQAFGRLLINAWTPLMSCGRDAPGIEIVPERVHEVTATIPATNQYDDLQISEELVRARYGDDAVLRPEMAPGDVLMLLGTTIHRTHIRPEMTRERYSLELRFGLE